MPSDNPRGVRLAELADRQHGVVSLAQLGCLAYAATQTKREVAAGRLHRIHRGVYAVGRRSLTARGRWMAAVLAYGDGAVLSHTAAAALWDLRPIPGGRIDVTTGRGLQRGVAGVRQHRSRTLHPSDCTVIDAIPVTTIPRLMLDLAETLNPQRLRRTLEEVERRELLDHAALRATIERNHGRHGIRPLREALSALTGSAPWTQSELEDAFLILVRQAGLPEPRCNVLLHGELVDCFWPDAPLVVELDSFGFHRSRSRFEDDRRKDVKLGLHGIPVLRYTQRRVEYEAATVISELTRMLAGAAAAGR